MDEDELTAAAERAVRDYWGTRGAEWQLPEVHQRRTAEKVVAALEPLIEARVREARADALSEAADEMEFIIANGDVAEVAAPVEGEVGRASAVSKRDRLYEDPVEWVRSRVEEVRG